MGARIAVLTRRFWPLIGETEFVAVNLAEELAKSSHVTILTSRSLPGWPTQFAFRGCQVLRLPARFSALRARRQFERAVGQFANERGSDLDGFLIFQDELPSQTLLTTINRLRIPAVVRIDPCLRDGHHDWFIDSLREIQANLPHPDLVGWATPAKSMARSLKSVEHVFHVRDGIKLAETPLPPGDVQVGDVQGEVQQGEFQQGEFQDRQEHKEVQDRQQKGEVQDRQEQGQGEFQDRQEREFQDRQEQKKLARQFLSKSHPLLQVRSDDLLFVYAGRMSQGRGLEQWIQAFPAVCRQKPSAKLWIVGEGKYEQQIWEHVVSLQLEENVVVGGVFDDLTDIFDAADLFLCGGSWQVESPLVLYARQRGLPVVVHDLANSGTGEIGSSDCVVLKADEPSGLGQMLVEVLSRQELLTETAESARMSIAKSHNITDCARRYLELVQQLNGRR